MFTQIEFEKHSRLEQIGFVEELKIGFEKLNRFYTGEDLNKLGFEFKPVLVLVWIGCGSVFGILKD